MGLADARPMNMSGLQKVQDHFCRESKVKRPPVQTRLNYLTLLPFYKIKNKLSPPNLQRARASKNE